MGQTVESFLDSRDGGRDGAFAGTWKAVGQECLSGRFVIQCKFTSRVDAVLKASDLSDEVEKTRKLVERGLCETYVLMTNAGITGTGEAAIKEVFEVAGVKHVVIFGATWIGQQIRENKRLRMLVPRVYGLGDLSQILDERAYAQARAILESMREDLSKVVVTDAYRRAVDAIDRHSFVLLTGEPAAGKTTIASLLAMAALDQWNASTLKLDAPGLVIEHWNPEEPSQFFWLDDAFGVTQYEVSLVHRWNHVLPRLPSMLEKGAKIVMTSRDYIYYRARMDLKESAFPLLKESQVVVDVHDFSAEEKRQILYNHLKLGKQPRSFRTRIKAYLEGIADHARFIPEIARRLADPFFTKNLVVDEYNVGQFVEKRERLLQEVLQGLDVDSKAALALIYMRSGRLESPVQLQPLEEQALDRIGSHLGGCVAALEALKDSLVVHSIAGSEAVWQFKHPTVGDAYGDILVQSTEHLGIFIEGSTPDRLVGQVTCGDVGIENAVVVPKSLYPQMLAKLEVFCRRGSTKLPWPLAFDARWDLQVFLARRCSEEFLSLYCQRSPVLFDKVSRPGLFLDTVPEVPLAIRLHEVGLLPDEKRKKFVETVSEYVIEGSDGDALQDRGIRNLFTDDEFDSLLQRVRTEVLPRLDDIRRDWEGNCPSGDSPDDYMQKLLEFFESLKAQLGEDKKSIRLVDYQVSLTNEWIEEKMDDEPEERSRRKLGAVGVPDETKGTRSIFDDIDADDIPEKK